MSIRMDESIVGTWFVQLTDESDWMMGVNKVDEGWEIQYRFRYYDTEGDGSPWNEKDKKSWYRGIAPSEHATEEEMLLKMNEMYQFLKKMSGGEGYALIRGEGSLDDFRKEFMNLPFVHSKEAPENA